MTPVGNRHISMPEYIGKDIAGLPWWRRVVTTVDDSNKLTIITQYSNSNDLDNWVDISTIYTGKEIDSMDDSRIVV